MFDDLNAVLLFAIVIVATFALRAFFKEENARLSDTNDNDNSNDAEEEP